MEATHITTELDGYSYKPCLKSATICVLNAGTNWNLCTINIVPEGSSGRQVHGGPQVPGPWPFTTTHPMIIDNHGGSAREREEAVKIEAGAPLTIDGLPGVWMLIKRDLRKFEGDGVKLVEYVEEVQA